MEDITPAIIILAHLRENGYDKAHIQNGLSFPKFRTRLRHPDLRHDYNRAQCPITVQAVQVGLYSWNLIHIMVHPETLMVAINRLFRVSETIPSYCITNPKWLEDPVRNPVYRNDLGLGSMLEKEILEKILIEVRAHEKASLPNRYS